MNTYTFEDLRVGMTVSFSVTLTREMQDTFLKLTGDTNPLHTDADFAHGKGFPAPVVYGLLTTAFYSTLCGVHLPGRDCLLHGVDVQFVKPCFVGDVLIVSGEVTHLNGAFKQVEMKASIANQAGDKISRAKIRAGFTS